MKKLFLGLIATVAFAITSFGQGQVDFRNSASALGTAQLVTDHLGAALAGPGFHAQLYYSTTGADGAFTAISAPSVEFRTGAGAGVWNWGTSALRDVPGTFGGQTVHLMVRAWSTASGSTYEAALGAGGLAGSSTAFAYTLGGTPQGGGTALLAPAMTGFQGFALQIPEPSTYALGALGIASLLMVRRRKA